MVAHRVEAYSAAARLVQLQLLAGGLSHPLGLTLTYSSHSVTPHSVTLCMCVAVTLWPCHSVLCSLLCCLTVGVQVLVTLLTGHKAISGSRSHCVHTAGRAGTDSSPLARSALSGGPRNRLLNCACATHSPGAPHTQGSEGHHSQGGDLWGAATLKIDCLLWDGPVRTDVILTLIMAPTPPSTPR